MERTVSKQVRERGRGEGVRREAEIDPEGKEPTWHGRGESRCDGQSVQERRIERKGKGNAPQGIIVVREIQGRIRLAFQMPGSNSRERSGAQIIPLGEREEGES